MESRKTSSGFTMALAMFTMVTLMTSTRAAAQTEKVLHDFSFSKNGKDGNDPQGNLIFDAAGNLYGTTAVGGTGLCGDGAGGIAGCGMVFELTPQAGGGWSEKVVHFFAFNGRDGQDPEGGLIFDASGNLYGTTAYGGTGSCSVSGAVSGCGTVFELIPKSGGWSVEILHNFNNDGKDGQNPAGGLIFDVSGDLYGTTRAGGAYGGGTAFKLTPKSTGWPETILHNFGNGKDGNSPAADLIFDSAGNLYGTAAGGGATNQGTVFELTPKSGGWPETILHSFSNNGTDGTEPESTLIFDADGNLYGMTYGGGVSGGGTVFELTSVGGGIWTETIPNAFSNGAEPVAGVISDGSGNLYGTTQRGGTNGAGSVFKLTPAGAGTWTETTLHSFNTVGADGCDPVGRLIFDSSGNLYGTAKACGLYGNGIVFEITP